MCFWKVFSIKFCSCRVYCCQYRAVQSAFLSNRQTHTHTHTHTQIQSKYYNSHLFLHWDVKRFFFLHKLPFQLYQESNCFKSLILFYYLCFIVLIQNGVSQGLLPSSINSFVEAFKIKTSKNQITCVKT